MRCPLMPAINRLYTLKHVVHLTTLTLILRWFFSLLGGFLRLLAVGRRAQWKLTRFMYARTF